MKHLSHSILLLICLTTLFFSTISSGCQSIKQNPTIGNNQSEAKIGDSYVNSIDVSIDIKAELTEQKHLKIFGETNLPDMTELLISINGINTSYKGQDKVVVNDNKFDSSNFSSDGEEFRIGQYKIDVTMPVPSTQSQLVQDKIGEKGENLKGLLVKSGDFGISVSTNKIIEIKSDGKISDLKQNVQVSNATISSTEIFTKLFELEKKGREMESLRNTNDLGKVKNCGNLMRENKKSSEELSKEIEKLPHPFSLRLKAVNTDLKSCVTCSSSAIESCNRAKSFLNEVKKDFEENHKK